MRSSKLKMKPLGRVGTWEELWLLHCHSLLFNFLYNNVLQILGPPSQVRGGGVRPLRFPHTVATAFSSQDEFGDASPPGAGARCHQTLGHESCPCVTHVDAGLVVFPSVCDGLIYLLMMVFARCWFVCSFRSYLPCKLCMHMLLLMTW